MMKDKKTYIIPNWYGLIFGVSILAAILLGATYSNNLVFAVAFFMLALFLLGMVQANANLKDLDIEKIHFSLAEENATGSGRIWLKNNSNEDHYQIMVKIPEIKEDFFFTVSHCEKKSSCIENFTFPSLEIGIKNIKQIKIASVFPFGMFYVWRNFSITSKQVTYPKAEGDLALPKNLELGESYISDFGLQGEDFSEHRKFLPGDNFRHVDWKAYAKGRPMLVKKFDDGETSNFILDLQHTSGDWMKRLRQLSKWVHECEAQKHAYSIRLGQEKQLSMGHGQLHKMQCLEQLAKLGEEYARSS